MGVTAHDHMDVCCDGIEVEIGDGMDEIEEMVLEFDGFGRREKRGVALTIDVAANGGDGSEVAKAIEDWSLTDVSGMEDVIGGGEGGERLGAKQTMGIRDDAYAHQAASCFL